MQNDIDDYLHELEDSGLDLSFDEIDSILEKCLDIARRRYPGWSRMAIRTEAMMTSSSCFFILASVVLTHSEPKRMFVRNDRRRLSNFDPSAAGNGVKEIRGKFWPDGNQSWVSVSTARFFHGHRNGATAFYSWKPRHEWCGGHP
jgi:hypothetical protein